MPSIKIWMLKHKKGPIKQHKKMKIVLAPMLDVTTPAYRKFIRSTSTNTELFTEMIVDETVLHLTDEKLKERIGEYDGNTVVQLGGSNHEKLASAVRKINKILGYTKFNLNCGCPSSKVQRGCFGAVLMTMKGLVSKIINNIHKETGIIISIKCRIGVDEQDSFQFFNEFINDIYVNTPCREIYVHARKCILKGLTPKANRNIPPLRYEFAYKIKEMYPDLKVYLNGGIKNLSDIVHLKNLDGFMIGRQAMKDIFIFKKFENFIYEHRNYENINQESFKDFEANLKTKIELVLMYVSSFDNNEIILTHYLFPILNAFHGLRHGRQFKQQIDFIIKNRMDFGTGKEIIKESLYIILDSNKTP